MSENRNRYVLLCQQALACALVAAVAAPAAGVVDLEFVAPPSGSEQAHAGAPDPGVASSSSLVSAEPVEPEITEVPLTDDRGSTLAPVTMRSRGGGDAGPAVTVTRPLDVDGYATVGVTWDARQRFEDDEIEVRVRTLADGTWSSWDELPYDADHGPDPGSPEAEDARNGTDALVVGAVDDVQVEVVSGAGELPEQMSVDVVDPGDTVTTTWEEPAIDTARLPSATRTTSAVPVAAELVGTPANVTPKPRIYSRAQWGADERLRDTSSLRYFEVHAGFVHHTVNANGYTREQVPSIIRGIYAYHTRSRGWSDLGYNFLVDRFGRIWEGRYGGVDRPVVGAHTLGYNDHAFAMSAIGNFETARPGDALLRAYGRLFAWKLSLHGVAAGSSRQRVAGEWMPAINGHRDAGQTACPGRYLYARISTIRKLAVGAQQPFTTRDKDTDLAGSRWPDLVVRDRDTHKAYIVKTGGQVGFGGPRRAATGWSGMDRTVPSPDLTGDGHADVLARDKATGVTGVYPGDGAGHFGAALRTTTRFRAVDQLAAIGDLNRDGRNDVVARLASNKRLLLYPGRGGGRFGTARVLKADWSAMRGTTAAGDFDRDGDVDLFARRDAQLLLVPGTPRGKLGAARALRNSWGGYDVVAGMGDLTGDGRPDIVGRQRASQRTYIYPGNGAGGFGTRFGPFTAMAGIDFLAAARRVTGNAPADLVGRSSSGRLVTFANRGLKAIDQVSSTGVRFGNTNLILNVGDWDGDGDGDVMTRQSSTGYLLFRAGDGRGSFGAPVVASKGWASRRLVAAVGDMTGDGYPDLMAQPRDGAMRIYPGNGRTGVRSSYPAHAAISANTQIGLGRWDSDGSPDTLLRQPDGDLVRFRGNGPGGLTSSAKVASNAGRYSRLIGAGDADGDGTPDVLARDGSGRLWLLPGSGAGFGPRRFVADGFGRFDLAG